MRIVIDGILSVRERAMFVGMATVRESAMFDEMVTGQENAIFDGTVTGRGMGMSDEIGPMPSAAEACATAMANDAFDLHSDGNQLTAIKRLEAID